MIASGAGTVKRTADPVRVQQAASKSFNSTVAPERRGIISCLIRTFIGKWAPVGKTPGLRVKGGFEARAAGDRPSYCISSWKLTGTMAELYLVCIAGSRRAMVLPRRV